MSRDHCVEHISADEFEWSFFPWTGIDGAVMICREHGLLAPGWVYDEELGATWGRKVEQLLTGQAL